MGNKKILNANMTRDVSSIELSFDDVRGKNRMSTLAR